MEGKFATIRNIGYILFTILPLAIHKQKLLLRRRGSIRSYLNLTVRFHQIGQDPYVMSARYKNGR